MPLADTRVVVDATAGGEVLPPLDLPDADPLDGAAASPSPSTSAGAPPTPPASSTPVPSATPAVGAVPGGIDGGELPGIFGEADLTPVMILLSLLTAAALGAGHALTPGHGKTLMAAYLVGTRGTPLHALGLGLSVSLSHTVGILVLAGIVVGAADVLPPDVVVRWAPVVAAVSIVAIGGWMLAGELRRRRSTGAGPRPRPRRTTTTTTVTTMSTRTSTTRTTTTDSDTITVSSIATVARPTATRPGLARRSPGAACSRSASPAASSHPRARC